MLKRVVSLCLAGVLAASITTPALAVRSGGNGGSPKAAAGTTTVTKPVVYSSTLSFSDIGSRVKANNLTLKSAQEGLKSAQAMNWDSSISDLEDAIDDLEDTMALLTSQASSQMTTATADLSKAIAAALSSVNALTDENLVAKVTTSLTTSILNASAAAAFSTYATMQQDSLQSNIDSLDDQLAELKKQKTDYAKTLADTERQIDYTADQTISGAESLYLTILSTNLQLESLKDSLASTARTVSELETRYRLGQISKMTLTQVQNGYTSLSNSVDNLENTIGTMKASLQSLMGETPTGTLTLLNTPTVSDKELSAISYKKDLAKAKEQSYSLYTAARSVESAEDSLEDARKDNGKNSYQYKMAEYSYQSAVYQQQAAVASFETSFQSLYKAIAPAQASLSAAQTDLEYQEQVYAVAQVKYKQGNLSANALLDAEDTLESAKRDVTSAQLDLYTAYHNYRQAVEQGLVGS